MSVTKKEVEHIEELAKLRLSEEEKTSMAKELDAIINYVAELSSVDTKDTEITINPIVIENRLREDVVGKELSNEEALANAPDRLEDYLKVPSVIEVEGDE